MAEKLIGSAIFGQSGGPTSVINSSAYGVIRTALDSDEITNVYGAENGIIGVLNDRLFDMSKEDADELLLLFLSIWWKRSMPMAEICLVRSVCRKISFVRPLLLQSARSILTLIFVWQ